MNDEQLAWDKEERAEEKKRFNNLKALLEQTIQSYEQKAIRYQQEYSTFVVYDYDDVDRKRILQSDLRRANENKNDFLRYVRSPYYGRIDLENMVGEIETYYIGREDITINHQSHVISWKSDIGDLYSRALRQKEFSLNRETYSLALRREIDIQEATLKEIRTTFDRDRVSLEGEIIDSFLLSVLRDKRRQKRLMDIVQTIQANQNKIMRLPQNINFAVQGCAGSGKTMILLHRLSVLLYQNLLDPFRTKIITPNEKFGLHINELSAELKLQNIRKYSIEGYYKKLIEDLSDKAYKFSAEIVSEISLDDEFLAEFYNESFMQEIKEDYIRFWQQRLKVLKAPGWQILLLRYKQKEVQIFANKSFELQKIKDIVAFIEEEKKQVDAKMKVLKKMFKRIDAEIEQFEERKAKICPLIKKLQDEFNQEFAQRIASSQNQLVPLKEEKSLIQVELGKIDEELSGLKELVQQQKAEVNQIEVLFKQADSDLSSLENEELKDYFDQYRLLEAKIAKVPKYNYIKKNRIKNEMDLLKKAIVEKLAGEHQEKSEEIARNIKDLESQIEEFEAEFHRFENKRIQLEVQENKLVDGLDEMILEKSKFMEGASTLNSLGKVFPQKQDQIMDYFQAKAEYEKIKKELDENHLKQKSKIEQEIDCFKRLEWSKEESQALTSVKKALADLTIRNLVHSIYDTKRKALVQKYGQKKALKAKYRFDLIYSLLIVSLFYPSLKNGDLYLNIDEAQDISLLEYHLLQSIVDKNCVFNLYGDVNQLIYGYKGIECWDDISFIDEKDVWVLDENYRNTIQITDYCNEHLGFELTPIGLTGPKVKPSLLGERLAGWEKQLKDGNQNRLAVLYHGEEELESIKEAIKNKQFYSIGQEVKDKISILSIEEAKGLEFEEVLVITARMTDNEKYIAYTRALHRMEYIS